MAFDQIDHHHHRAGRGRDHAESAAGDGGDPGGAERGVETDLRDDARDDDGFRDKSESDESNSTKAYVTSGNTSGQKADEFDLSQYGAARRLLDLYLARRYVGRWAEYVG